MGCCCSKGNIVAAEHGGDEDGTGLSQKGQFNGASSGGPHGASGNKGTGPNGSGMCRVMKSGVFGRSTLTKGAAGTGGAGGGDGANEDGQTFEEIQSQSAVKVAVMVRPLLEFEKAKDAKDVVQILPPGKIKLPAKPTGGMENSYPFDFDRVYKADNPTAGRQMYEDLVLPVVERFCEGFNGTVLAYGQTGAGKTFTMGTSSSMKELLSKEPQGVIPRLLESVFQYVTVASKQYDIVLKVTYIELYNEQVNDLLSKPDGAKANNGRLDIREKPDGEIYVEGATETQVKTREAIAQVLDQGNSNRATASHKMNTESSRSHAIVTIIMEQRAKLSQVKNIPDELRFLRSKLHLVDLAGSERVKDTGATGDRFNEGVSINKGLLELGNVINALTEGNKRQHIPYRNSKLTRVLQDSLGGNSETLFLGCVSPSDQNHDATLQTLRYASRARNIKNNLRLNNKLTLEEEVEYLRTLVLQLQTENSELKQKMHAAGLA